MPDPVKPDTGVIVLPDKKFQLRKEWLEEIYSRYPRKEGKSRGFEKLRTKLKSDTEVGKFAQAVKNYADDVARKGTEARYMKHFATFVGEWEDWLDPMTGTSIAQKKIGMFDLIPDETEVQYLEEQPDAEA